MASQKTKLAVGAFVASGIILTVLAVIWLGMSRFLEKGQYYATYLNESVQGLQKDSPVKYRGVTIGRVQSIGVAPDSKLIQVVLKIESGQPLDSDMVAQLRNVGITGSMFVELDRKKKGEPDQSPRLTFPSEYPVVASKPSEISELIKGIDDFLKQASSMDLKGVSEKVKLTLDRANQMMEDADVKGISTDVKASLERVDYILDKERWDRILTSIGQVAGSLNSMMVKAERTVSRAERTLGRLDKIIEENRQPIRTAVEELERALKNANIFLEKGASVASGTDDSVAYLRRYLLVVAQNLEKATQNLNRLMGLLVNQPSQLIFGAAPAPRKVEPEAKGD
jgi:phospholipid/cholesterol/gamma-HCH transport system substrate-binding protein